MRRLFLPLTLLAPLLAWGPVLALHAAEEAKPAADSKKTDAKPESKSEGGELKGEGKDVKAGATAPVTPTVLLPNNERVFSPAEVLVLTDLDAKKVELERRTQALELREKLADLMERRLADKTKELQDLKSGIEQLMVGLSGRDDKDLNQLSQMYAAMKPAAAAGVLNKLDNRIVHDVLMRMPVKKSGKIMEALDPVKARFISEMIAEQKVAGDVLTPSATQAAIAAQTNPVTTPAAPISPTTPAKK